MEPGALTRVGAHLRVVSRLAEGGMGIVYAAVDEREADPVRARRAVKVLKGGGKASAFEARFRRECEVAQRLGGHAGIVAVLEHGRLPSDELYCVMEFVAGESLGRRFSAGVPAEEAARLVAAVAQAVAFAHEQGVIHRDLKPENVIVTPQGVPRLTDFGIAKALAEDPLTATGMVMGTPHFMAPEQAADSKRVDPRTDVWGLGAILYFGLTRVPPLDLDGLRTGAALRAVVASIIRRPRERVPGIDPALDAICMQALARDPARRYQTARDLARALEAWVAGDRTMPTPPPEGPSQGEDDEGSLAIPVAIAVVLAVIVGGAVLAMI